MSKEVTIRGGTVGVTVRPGGEGTLADAIDDPIATATALREQAKVLRLLCS